MNEFDLIDLIRSECRQTAPGLVIGIGDDAAVANVPVGQQLVVCTDTLIGGRHFPITTTPEDIGWKALAVNLSDLAAMGATPAYALLALTMPSADQDWLRAFARGFAELASLHQVALIGGDTTRGDLSITVTALGTVPTGQAILRSGAGIDDCIVLTGAIGLAAAALPFVMADESALLPVDSASTLPPAHWLQALRRPSAQVAAGLALRGLASSAIDISDGLLADLGHVLNQSEAGAGSVGAEIFLDAIPGYSELTAVLGSERAQQCVLAGGDDYVLCATVPTTHWLAAQQAFCERGLPPLQVIGKVTAGSGIRVIDAQGQPVSMARPGWDHFVSA